MGRRGYPAEFRRRVLGLIAAGRSIGAISTELGISEQTIYTWRRQERIDRGLEPGVSSTDHVELVAAGSGSASSRPRSRFIEERPNCSGGDVGPKGGTRRSK